jgi:hypothetical protein
MIGFFILLLKSLCGSQVGMKNVRTYLYSYIVKSKQRSREKDAILLNQDVHACTIYIVANLILLCSLETCLSYFKLENFARAYGLSFHTFFSFSLFLLTWTLVHFYYTLFLHIHISLSCT